MAHGRTVWKGAISFGLLYAPVSMYPASHQDEVDFDWLQKKTLEPVGYKRVVKNTGKEIERDDIVKGVKYEGQYVVLSDEEIQSANVKSTQSIDIVGFTSAEDLSFVYFETPYYLEPVKGGEKVYALLREAMLKTGKVAIAIIVMRNKQHLAALIATPDAIALNTLRWADEVRDTSDLSLPPPGLKGTVKPAELEMAVQLVESMHTDWQPEEYRDTFRDDIMAMVKRKYDAGEASQIKQVQIEAPEHSTDTDLAELLRRSLQGSPKSAAPAPKAATPTAARKRAAPSAHRPVKSAH